MYLVIFQEYYLNIKVIINTSRIIPLELVLEKLLNIAEGEKNITILFASYCSRVFKPKRFSLVTYFYQTQ